MEVKIRRTENVTPFVVNWFDSKIIIWIILRFTIRSFRSKTFCFGPSLSFGVSSRFVWLQLFMRLKHERPKFYHKVSAMAGDASLPGLGLSSVDRQTLADEVNIVFHCAATIRFDEHIRTAININVLGTREIIKLAKEMNNLKVIYDLKIENSCHLHFCRSSTVRSDSRDSRRSSLPVDFGAKRRRVSRSRYLLTHVFLGTKWRNSISSHTINSSFWKR